MALCAFFDVPNLPFLHTLRARFGLIFVGKCSGPNVGSQRGTFCMGKKHKRPLAGPGAGEDQSTGSAWEGTWTSSPTSRPAVLTVPTGPVHLVVAHGRPVQNGPIGSGPPIYGPDQGRTVVEGRLQRTRTGEDGQGGLGVQEQFDQLVVFGRVGDRTGRFYSPTQILNVRPGQRSTTYIFIPAQRSYPVPASRSSRPCSIVPVLRPTPPTSMLAGPTVLLDRPGGPTT